jgi:alcohol dehydrogenase class IV
MYAWKAIWRVSQDLPRVLADACDLDARESMAWADTLAGYSIANAGVTLPHGMGMAIGGMYPNVAHGAALAAVYPAFVRFTWQHAIPQFAKLGRTLDSTLDHAADAIAAERSSAAIEVFLAQVGLRLGLQDLAVPKAELVTLAKQCMVLPDYRANPRVATPAEMEELVRDCFPAQRTAHA